MTKNSPLWSQADFVAATGGKAGPGFDQPVSGISIDSRSLSPGDAFFAIRGDKFDGHDFVARAFDAGASVAIVENGREECNGLGPVVQVGDVLEALENVGRAARHRMSGRVIAITGSVGKTGTKEALREALSGSGSVHASIASFNNHWGVPLTLSRMPTDTRFGIFEVGMNHPNEITPLTQMIRPHIALVTNVQAVHLSYFKSVDEIAAAKAEIFDGLEPDGIAILNQDNKYFDFLVERAGKAGAGWAIGFGQAEHADARLVSVSLQSDCSIVQADILGDRLTYKIGAPGQHLVTNSLGVLAAVKVAGGDLALAALSLGQWVPPKGRGARKTLVVGNGQMTLIDESYNANPASMVAALSVLGRSKPGPGGRRVAVLGDMLELGDKGPSLHANLLTSIEKHQIDIVYTAGPLMKSLYNVLPAAYRGGHAEDSKSLAAEIPQHISSGDIVMVKGSNGSRTFEIVEGIEAYFADSKREGLGDN